MLHAMVLLPFAAALLVALLPRRARTASALVAGAAMLGFVLPITVLTLAVSLAGELKARRG